MPRRHDSVINSDDAFRDVRRNSAVRYTGEHMFFNRHVSFTIAVSAALTTSFPSQAKQPLTRIQQACFSWDLSLQRMLGWSEEYAIHPPELRMMVRAEAARLRERCTFDVTPATINRYVVLSKMLYDDEADEVEGFD